MKILRLFFSPLLFPLILFAQSIVINEIAWMGTAASYTDEWIELYNLTADSIDLTNWRLSTADGTPDIRLRGSIAGSGFFVLERTDDATISDQPASQIYIGDLGNNGEHLLLQDAGGRTVDEVDCSGGWFAGRNSQKFTMERVHPHAPGSNDSSWADNDGIKHNGLDAAGQPINGTPGESNSTFRISKVKSETLLPEMETLTGQPNPFKTGTQILLPGKQGGRLIIYDLLGREIRILTGGPCFVWDGFDRNGSPVHSGAYFGRFIDAQGLSRMVRLLKLE